jgi:hypothetical protein
MAGVALISFGPPVFAYAKNLGLARWNQIIPTVLILTILILTLVLVTYLAYGGIAYAPRSFQPPATASRNPDGTSRIFTTETPAEIERPFGNDTSLRARQQFEHVRGLWIGITGLVTNATLQTDRSILVRLSWETTSVANAFKRNRIDMCRAHSPLPDPSIRQSGEVHRKTRVTAMKCRDRQTIRARQARGIRPDPADGCDNSRSPGECAACGHWDCFAGSPTRRDRRLP